jgi:hypothetical protein
LGARPAGARSLNVSLFTASLRADEPLFFFAALLPFVVFAIDASGG